MRRYGTLLWFFILIISCNKGEAIPAGIIKPDKMEKIFWDMIKGDLLAQENIKKDSAKNIKNESLAIAEKIFSIHNITRKQFEESVIFYEKHPALIKTMFDSLNSNQTRTNFLQNEWKIKHLNDFHHSPTK